MILKQDLEFSIAPEFAEILKVCPAVSSIFRSLITFLMFLFLIVLLFLLATKGKSHQFLKPKDLREKPEEVEQKGV